MTDIDKQINKQGRDLALKLQSLMALVEQDYNEHEPCLVCNEKFKHHIDKLPCNSDTERKQIVRRDRWGNTKEKNHGTS